jgi:hypothetical protein
MRTFAIAAAVLLTLGACGPKSQHVTPQDRNLITADEIAKSNATNAYEAVERLRPAFLRTRGSQSLQNQEPPTPMIYIDGMRYGPLQTLSSVPAVGIVTIQYLNAIEATQRFGFGNEGGAIMITTKH